MYKLGFGDISWRVPLAMYALSSGPFRFLLTREICLPLLGVDTHLDIAASRFIGAWALWIWELSYIGILHVPSINAGSASE